MRELCSAIALPLVMILLLAPAGCFRGQEASAGPDGPGAAGQAPAGPVPDVAALRPPFLVYETTGRRVMTDALGNDSESRLAQRIYASDKGLRTETLSPASGARPSAPAPVGILRLDRKLMWQINAADGTYAEVTFAEAAESVRGVRELLARRLREERLPPEKRRAYEVVLGQRQPRIEVRADPQTVEILGRKCRHISYLEDGELRIEEWAAEGLLIPCDMSEIRALTGDFSPGLLKELRRRQSFALKARIIGRLPGSGIPRLSEFEVTRLELPEKLDPGLFEVPAGCRLTRPAARAE
ncbi:MAG TPA: hypothetical protein PK280_00580 [Planctomycetota bacterium]|nr:hypothetical protein [Planctomycetota bacterium]